MSKAVDMRKSSKIPRSLVTASDVTNCIIVYMYKKLLYDVTDVFHSEKATKK